MYKSFLCVRSLLRSTHCVCVDYKWPCYLKLWLTHAKHFRTLWSWKAHLPLEKSFRRSTVCALKSHCLISSSKWVMKPHGHNPPSSDRTHTKKIEDNNFSKSYCQTSLFHLKLVKFILFEFKLLSILNSISIPF